MIKISNSILVSIFTKLLILLLIAKMISLAVWWYLPSEGIELNIKKSYQPKYQRVNFHTMIKAEVIVKPVEKKKPTTSITNMVLKGLYGTTESAFVIVAMKSAPANTSIISIDEEYKGFILKSITPDSAIFQKSGKNYILELEKVKKDGAITRVKKTKKATINSSEPQRDVSRQDIAYYAKNPKQIWRDISIKEVRKSGKITGFRVNKIEPNSRFAALGLQKGDVIIKANNVELKSYRDALNIYNNIDKVDTVEIVVIRDNQEKELIYEIN